MNECLYQDTLALAAISSFLFLATAVFGI